MEFDSKSRQRRLSFNTILSCILLVFFLPIAGFSLITLFYAVIALTGLGFYILERWWPGKIVQITYGLFVLILFFWLYAGYLWIKKGAEQTTAWHCLLIGFIFLGLWVSILVLSQIFKCLRRTHQRDDKIFKIINASIPIATTVIALCGVLYWMHSAVYEKEEGIHIKHFLIVLAIACTGFVLGLFVRETAAGLTRE